MSPPLALALEVALLRELRELFGYLNWTHFHGVLAAPQFALSDAAGFLGRWNRATRTIEISRAFILGSPWGSVVEVLKHELAHQYVTEVLRETETPHGAAFQATCERLGIDPTSAGLPRTGQPDAVHPLLDRVQKLLALAQSDNRHEAEAAAAAAQKLILKHNLQPGGGASARQYSFRHLGRATGRVAEWQRALGSILGSHFCVEVLWVPVYRVEEGKRGSVLEVIGTLDNLELAEYVHDFLSRSAEQAWERHRKLHRLGNRDRLSYLAGVMHGFSAKLSEQARVHAAGGLVWVPLAQLREYASKRYPRLRRVTWGGGQRGDAFVEGHRAGREVVLNRGLTQPSGGEIRLLGKG